MGMHLVQVTKKKVRQDNQEQKEQINHKPDTLKAAGGMVMMVDLAWRWLSWRWCGGVASAVGGWPEVGRKKGDGMMGVMMICRSMVHVNRSVVVRSLPFFRKRRPGALTALFVPILLVMSEDVILE
ncbi:hypothetical protein Tco_1532877 [Tanacetum coccineum]